MKLNRALTTLKLTAILCALSQSGCIWQKDDYTERMQGSLKGSAAKAFGIVKIWTPEGFQFDEPPAGFQGFIRGDNPPLEILVLGSDQNEQMARFQTSALKTLNDVGYGPSSPLLKGEPQNIGRSWEGYQVEAPRQMGGASVDYFWYVYCTADGNNRAMLAFLIPKDKYSDYGDSMMKVLKSLKFGTPPAEGEGEAEAPAE